MNIRFIFLSLLVSIFGCFSSEAQDSTTTAKPASHHAASPQTVQPFLSDSAANVNRQRSVADSIVWNYIIPDSAKMRSHFLDSIMTGVSTDFFLQHPSPKKSTGVQSGRPRNTREIWVIGVILFLLAYTGMLNAFFGADMRSVLSSFYNKNSISQSDKEGGLINSRVFVGLILLFCFTVGLILYELTSYYDVPHTVSGFQLFLLLSGLVGLLVALKFVLLKFVGFVFETGNQVSEYIAVLNLTYFNLAFLLLAVLVCFGLLANQFIPVLLRLTLGAAVVIFLWQYVRNSLGVISGFRFHKFYLFIYLCALEICPVLILIKALNL